MERPSEIVKAKCEVIGVEIKNHQDECLGCIKEIMLDKLSGNVRYIVVCSGGFMGMGCKYNAIPWNAIEYTKSEECFKFKSNISKEEFKNAPGFNKDSWPNMADMGWGKTVHSYYKTKPFWE